MRALIFTTIKVVGYVSAAIIILLYGFAFFAEYLFRYEPKDIEFEFPRLINSVLGMPYHTSLAIKSDTHDITKFAKEEWFNFRCVPAESDISENRYSAYAGDTKNLPTNISNKDITHLNCLAVDRVSPYANVSSKAVNGELCNNYYNCRLFNLAVKDYVLDKPEILWNIVKIIERPCDYVKTMEEATNQEEKDAIDSMRSALKCDGQKEFWHLREKVFVKLVIQDLKNKRIAHVIVRRKDI